MKLKNPISISRTNANQMHSSLSRWPFAATLHAKRQSLDWYPHMKNIFIGQMTKVLAETLDLRTGTGHLQVTQTQCDERRLSWQSLHHVFVTILQQYHGVDMYCSVP